MRVTETSGIVCQITDRLHVSTSRSGVIRAVRRKLRRKVRRAPALRAARKAIYREALERHAENQDLYRLVMTGRPVKT